MMSGLPRSDSSKRDLKAAELEEGVELSEATREEETKRVRFNAANKDANNARGGCGKEEEEEEEVDMDLGAGAGAEEEVAAGASVFCCEAVAGFQVPIDTAVPLAGMIRAVFNALGPLIRGVQSATTRAFDISFLLDSDDLGDCVLAHFEAGLYQIPWRTRPRVWNVASCHPMAERLTRWLSPAGAVDEEGTLGTDPSEETSMDRHNLTAQRLCFSLSNNARGIWWVSHCGHSFCLIKREEPIDRIEVIDAYANDRGLGLWCLSHSEIAQTRFPNRSDHLPVNMPPERRLWGLGDLQRTLSNMVDLPTVLERQGAQEELLGIGWENRLPADQKADYLAATQTELRDDQVSPDYLPNGAFGYRRYGLVSDDEMCRIVISRLWHAYDRIKPHSKTPLWRPEK